MRNLGACFLNVQEVEASLEERVSGQGEARDDQGEVDLGEDEDGDEETGG